MIANLFIKIVIWMTYGISAIIPNWFIPDTITDSISVMVQSSLEWNAIFPIGSILFCILAIITFNLIIYIVNVISGFISLLRGSGKIDI